MAVTPIYGFTLPVVAGDSGIWGGELNTDITSVENEIARPRLPFVSPTYNVGGTTTLDLNQSTGGRVFVFTVSGASTLAFSNVPSASFAVPVQLKITNGGAFALTFPASVTWLPGSAPVFKAAGVDWVTLWTTDAGATWSAFHPIQTIFQAQKVSTTSGSDVSLASIMLPAGLLSANGQALRITLAGRILTGTATVNLKFGASTITSLVTGSNDEFFITAIVTRTGAATQWSSLSIVKAGAPTGNATSTLQTETLANAILLDFRGNATTAGQILTYDTIQVELLARN